MFNKIKTTLLLIGVLSAAAPVSAEIFIVNTPNSNIGGAAAQGNQQQQAGQLQMPQVSLSNVDPNKINLLQRYKYAERAPVVNGHQRNLQMMSMQIAGWMQHGAAEQSVAKARELLKQTDSEIQQSMAALEPGLELPELQQLYNAEQQNARTVRDLSKKLEKVRITARMGSSVPGNSAQPAVSVQQDIATEPASAPQSQ